VSTVQVVTHATRCSVDRLTRVCRVSVTTMTPLSVTQTSGSVNALTTLPELSVNFVYLASTETHSLDDQVTDVSVEYRIRRNSRPNG